MSNELEITYQRLLEYKTLIDDLANNSLGKKIFGQVSLPPIHPSLAECNFQRLISWLYTLYWDQGKSYNIKFLIKKCENEFQNDLRSHFEIINSLRTVFQHNVTDSHLIIKCGQWFTLSCGEELCNNNKPIDAQAWDKCLNKLINDSDIFMRTILSCIEKIKIDELAIEEWKSNYNGSLSTGDCDILIRELLSDLGINSLRASKFREKYYTKLTTYLSIPSTIDIEKRAKQFLLTKIIDDLPNVLPLPVDIEDIISTFEIERGTQLLLQCMSSAGNIYKASINEGNCLGKQEILDRLEKLGYKKLLI